VCTQVAVPNLLSFNQFIVDDVDKRILGKTAVATSTVEQEVQFKKLFKK
jgi:hypothetical protein